MVLCLKRILVCATTWALCCLPSALLFESPFMLHSMGFARSHTIWKITCCRLFSNCSRLLNPLKGCFYRCHAATGSDLLTGWHWRLSVEWSVNPANVRVKVREGKQTELTETNRKYISDVMNGCGQEGSVWHIQYGGTVITLARSRVQGGAGKCTAVTRLIGSGRTEV